MSEWNTEQLPDFTVEGFHTGRKVQFRLSDGRELTDIYQGWGIFGIGLPGEATCFDWIAGEPHVVAWRATANNTENKQ